MRHFAVGMVVLLAGTVLSGIDRPLFSAKPKPGALAAKEISAQNAFQTRLSGSDFRIFGAALKRNSGNFVCSPQSLSRVFSLLYQGARGNTAKQLADFFGYGDPLYGEKVFQEKAGGDVTFQSVSAIWLDEMEKLNEDYAAKLKESGAAELFRVNFALKPDQAMRSMNEWASRATKGRISSLLPPESLESLRLVLANALYFKAPWSQPFDEGKTVPREYHALDGNKAIVPMMHASQSLPYGSDVSVRMVVLPYAGGRWSFFALLPEASGAEAIAALEEGLTAERFEKLRKNLQRKEVLLTLPRFSAEAVFAPEEPLRACGVTDVFDPAFSDLSGIAPGKLYVSKAVQKISFSVDERGSEGAAVSALGVATALPVPEEPVVFCADRPFLYLIRDNRTGGVLFAGRVASIR